MALSEHDYLRQISDETEKISEQTTAIAAALGVTPTANNEYGDPNSGSTPVNGDAILVRSSYANRDGIFISNGSLTSVLGVAFGAANIGSVGNTTISVYVAPLGTQKVEIPSLVSKDIYVKSMDSSVITFVYHLKDDGQDNSGDGDGGLGDGGIER